MTEDKPPPEPPVIPGLPRPLPFAAQIAALFAAFAGGPLLGSGLGRALGVRSEAGEVFVILPLVLVFFTGYATWAARVHAIGFELIGKGLLKLLLHLLLKRKLPENAEQVLPSREAVVRAVIRVRRAASSFLAVSIPLSALSALIGALVDAPGPAWGRASILAAATLGWGWLLSMAGRRGWLPIPEEGE